MRRKGSPGFLTPRALACGLLFVAPLALGATGATGQISILELTALTKDQASIWLRTTLPQAAKGSRQSFEGTVSVGGVAVPVRSPVVAAIQPGSRSLEAVFLVEVPLATVPEGVLGELRLPLVPLRLKGTLRGDAGSSASVSASGSVKAGSPSLVAPASLVSPFARLADARLAGLSLATVTAQARLAVYNPFSFDILVKEIRYELQAAGRTLASGSTRGIRIRSKRDNEIDLKMTAATTDLAAALGEALLRKGALDGRLVGKVVLKLGQGETTVPLDLAGTVQVIP